MEFVPNLVKDKKNHIFLKEWCKDEGKKAQKEKIEEEFAKDYTLKLTTDNFQYIIVSNDDEALEMVHFIEKNFAGYGEDTVKILSTCIMTANVIFED